MRQPSNRLGDLKRNLAFRDQPSRRDHGLEEPTDEMKNLAQRVIKLETINSKKSRRFIVRYENPETGLLEPTELDADDAGPADGPEIGYITS